MPLITSSSSILLDAVTDVTEVTRSTLLAGHLRAIFQTSAHVLQAEVHTLLAKDAVEMVPLANSKSGFFSRYSLVPKKDGGLQPILDLRHLNRFLMQWTFRILTFAEGLFSVCGSERHILSHHAITAFFTLLRSVGTQLFPL